MRTNNEYADAFRNYTLEELVALHAKETRHNGWIAARGRYLAALRQEFQRRAIDTSHFIDEYSMSLRSPLGIVLVPADHAITLTPPDHE